MQTALSRIWTLVTKSVTYLHKYFHIKNANVKINDLITSNINNVSWINRDKSNQFAVMVGWLLFNGISTIADYLMPNPCYTYVLNIYDLVWLGFLWHINHCRLFNVKSSLYIYIRYMIRFGWVSWHINYCRLFNAKSS